jgi:hypothetical protein
MHLRQYELLWETAPKNNYFDELKKIENDFREKGRKWSKDFKKEEN